MTPMVWNVLCIWILCVTYKLTFHLFPWKHSWFIFLCRNRLFQVLYVLLLGAGHVELVVDILPQLYSAEYDVNHTLMPMVLLAANVILFVVCSYR